MLLREHPLFRYHNIPSWPPVWTWTGGLDNERPRGEIGILRRVELSNVLPADRCFLYIEYEGSSYIGCLMVDDYGFCDQIVKLLQNHCNCAIADIGSLDLSHLCSDSFNVTQTPTDR
jgi:hypothetical protein